MREDFGPAHAAANALHRTVASLQNHWEIANMLVKISPATIDRYLKKDKESLRLKGKSLTKPMASLKSRIPIRTFYTSEEWKKPGFW
jgi:hypothetical protein